MARVYTFPDSSTLADYERVTPPYMYPSKCPDVVIGEEFLTDDICDEIVESFKTLENYKFPKCNARTTEYPLPLSSIFAPITKFGLEANEIYFDFNLDSNPVAWGQTYFATDDYSKHTDSRYGQTRKLTVIALLTNPEEYTGGELVVHIYPNAFIVPNKRGTMIVFPPWILHEVLAVKSGIRRTINMGFWGPPFR